MLLVLSLGSNAGDSIQLLYRARVLLAACGIDTLRFSTVYKTEPQYDTTKPWYYNQVLLCTCQSEPDVLLQHILTVEEKLGRVRIEHDRYAARTMDIDILLYGTHAITTTMLSIPHPRMFERAFVLVPLLELFPDECIDGKKYALQAALKKLNYSVQGTTIRQTL